MARKHHHEEHQNHEAWAIPYGDLITLLLAFFVVMYAVSSVNEGKYRVLADALAEAFGGPPKSLKPLQVGKPAHGNASAEALSPRPSAAGAQPVLLPGGRIRTPIPPPPKPASEALERERAKLENIARAVEQSLSEMIARKLVVVRRTELWVEIEIKTDVLFDSGSAQIDAAAIPVMAELAGILAPHPNRIRVEGHTDNIPISTAQFPSNWELSAARAASVLRVLANNGLDPARMSVLGLGEFHPRADNATPSGRNANRRVALVLLAEPTPDVRGSS